MSTNCCSERLMSSSTSSTSCIVDCCTDTNDDDAGGDDDVVMIMAVDDDDDCSGAGGETILGEVFAGCSFFANSIASDRPTNLSFCLSPDPCCNCYCLGEFAWFGVRPCPSGAACVRPVLGRLGGGWLKTGGAGCPLPWLPAFLARVEISRSLCGCS